MEVRVWICIQSINKAMLRLYSVSELRQRTRQLMSSNNARQESKPTQP